MEQAITGQVDLSDNTGFSNPTLGCSCTKTLPTSSDGQGNEFDFECGTSLSPLQRNSSEVRYCQSNISDICVSSFHYSEEERRALVDSEPKSIESVSPKAAFQNGWSPHVTRHPPSVGLNGENRFKRGILCSSCPP